jgi:predicted P-loop ATPase
MIAFWEQPGDFYEQLPLVMPAGATRKQKKVALNIVMNGGGARRVSDVGWSLEDAEAFIDSVDALWTTKWPTAGAFVHNLRDQTAADPEWIAHRREKAGGRTPNLNPRIALGTGLMRLESEALHRVFNHPDFNGVYGAHVACPMRDGFLVECHKDQQDALIDWLMDTMTLEVTGSSDRAEHHSVEHIHADALGTSWGQVDGEDVAPLIGTALKVAGRRARMSPSSDDYAGLLLACAFYPDHMAAAKPTGAGSHLLKRQIARASADMSAARTRKENRDNPPAPVDPNMPVLTTTTNNAGVTRVDDTMSNLHTVLTGDPQINLWWNEWDKEVYHAETNEKVDLDCWESVLARRCEQAYGWRMSFNMGRIKAATMAAAKEDSRHPLKDSIEAMKWDGIKRLDTWLQEVVYHPVMTDSGFRLDLLEQEFDISKDEFTLTGIYGRQFLIAMMARLYAPGEKVDHCLVLSGVQGAGKQRFFQALAGVSPSGESYYTGTAREESTKEAALQGLRVWLWEDQEMASHKGKSRLKGKQFLSDSQDLCRLPYGMRAEIVKRHWVPCGSTNDPEKLLSDPTGSRRFRVVRLPQYLHVDASSRLQPALDVKYVEKYREQLLAEAREAYKKGEVWYFDKTCPQNGWMFELQAKVNKSTFTETNELDDFAVTVFQRNSGGFDAKFKLQDFLSAWGGSDLNAKDRVTGSLKHQASDALKAAGFMKKKFRDGNFWYKPEVPGAPKLKVVSDGLYGWTVDPSGFPPKSGDPSEHFRE